MIIKLYIVLYYIYNKIWTRIETITHITQQKIFLKIYIVDRRPPLYLFDKFLCVHLIS